MSKWSYDHIGFNVEPHDLFLLPLPYLERRLTQTKPIHKLRVESVLVHWEALELDHIFSW